VLPDEAAGSAEPDLLDADLAELEFVPRARDRQEARRGRRNAKPFFRDSVEKLEGAVETPTGDAAQKTGPEAMTYKPARYEAVWLAASLRSFYEQELIVDVLAQVKGGKEASVYRCAAHPRLGVEFLAAKVYRPRQFRNLRNDSLYREGRAILTVGGSAVSKRDRRTMLAVAKKTEFGAKLQHTSWLMHEYLTLERLHQAGASVPRPYGSNENAILMTYVGDERRAAPTLSEIRLGHQEARPLFAELLRNVELMLSLGLVHGDLSAYNVLYWNGQVVLIDFPQGTSSQANQSARFILNRDVQRVCEYFARQGVPSDYRGIAADLADRYIVSG
jgi:RIO kinase 1